jgi:hypothetical protein
VRESGLKIVLATSSDKEDLPIYGMLVGMDDLMDEASTSADAKASKPESDIFAAALRKVKMRPEQAVALGDTPWDAQAEGKAGLVLIGMPVIEKRIARFPQFYSRIGFVHKFRPLDAAQLQQLLESRWAPADVKLSPEQLSADVIASLTRMTGGNFRLLERLLTQIERVLDVNDLNSISDAVVEAARDSLVIGPA